MDVLFLSFRESEDVLRLSLEEAFFLNFALGSLVIKKDSVFLTVDEVWSLFTKTFENFAAHYAVYHHFRCEGWIVKSGMKFGSDFRKPILL